MKIHPFAVPIEQEKPHLHQYDHERRRPLAQYASFSWSPFRCPAIIRCPTVPANYGSQLAHEEIHCGAARCFGHYGRRPFWTSGGASRCVRSAGFGWRRSRTAIRGTIWGFVRVPLYSSPGSFGIRPKGPLAPRPYFRTIRLNKARAFGSYGSVANRYGGACIRATTSSSPGKT